MHLVGPVWDGDNCAFVCMFLCCLWIWRNGCPPFPARFFVTPQLPAPLVSTTQAELAAATGAAAGSAGDGGGASAAASPHQEQLAGVEQTHAQLSEEQLVRGTCNPGASDWLFLLPLGWVIRARFMREHTFCPRSCVSYRAFVTAHRHSLLLWCARTFRRQHLLSKLDSMEDSLMAVDSFDLEGYAAVGCPRHHHCLLHTHSDLYYSPVFLMFLHPRDMPCTSRVSSRTLLARRMPHRYSSVVHAVPANPPLT